MSKAGAEPVNFCLVNYDIDTLVKTHTYTNLHTLIFASMYLQNKITLVCYIYIYMLISELIVVWSCLYSVRVHDS